RRISWLHIRHAIFTGILQICAGLGQPVTLPPEVEYRRTLGLVGDQAFAELKDALPKWFTRELFLSVMAAQVQYLADIQAGRGTASDIVSVIGSAVEAVDQIRKDPALVQHAGYQRLWPPQRGQAAQVAPEDQAPITTAAAGLILYAETRPRTTKAA